MTSYPQLEKAILNVVYDNGCINCFSTEESVMEVIMPKIYEEFPAGMLALAEEELSSLSDDQIYEFAVGGELSDDKPVCTNADRVLDFAFEIL